MKELKTFTKIIVTKQYQICICTECNHHIPLGKITKISPNTKLTCPQCKSEFTINEISEQTLNVAVSVKSATLGNDPWDTNLTALYPGPSPEIKKGDKVVFRKPHEVNADVPQQKQTEKHPLFTESDTDVFWKCKVCNDSNYELMVVPGEDISCRNCGTEYIVEIV